MEIIKVLKSYFKWALLLTALIAFAESFLHQGTSTNSWLKHWVGGYPLEFYLLDRGGANRKNP
jgi:hypothetical protein